MTVDIVDEHDNVTGTASRATILERGLNFRVVHVLLHTSDGRVHLQRIGAQNTRSAGMLGSTVAGYMFAGESYREAAIRRTFQELGIVGLQLFEAGRLTMRDERSLKFITLFTGQFDDPILSYDRNHIAEMLLIPADDLKHRLQSQVGEFSATSIRVLNYWLRNDGDEGHQRQS